MRNQAVRVLTLVVASAAPLIAQHLVTRDLLFNRFCDQPTNSPAFPGSGSAGARYPAAPGFLAGPGAGGGLTVDESSGLVYATDGYWIQAAPHPGYSSTSPVPTPILTPFGLAVPITGMAIDPTGAPGGILYVTDGLSFVALSPVGSSTVSSVFNITPLPGGQIVQGLEWDSASSALYGVDGGGTIWQIPVGGGIPSFVLPSILLPTPDPAVGLAIDKTASMLTFYVAYQHVGVYDRSGTFVPVLVPQPVCAPLIDGVAFHNLPATLSSAGTCASGGSLSFAPNSSALAGNGSFAVTLTGAPLLASLWLAFDLPTAALVPSGLPFGQNGTLYIDLLFSPTAQLVPFGPAPSTPVVLGLPLAASLPNGPLGFIQWIAACQGSPFYVVSNALQISISRP